MTDESVFAAALAIHRPDQRAAYLEKACAGKPGLRREVEALLEAHAADNLLDRPRPDALPTSKYEADHHDTGIAAVGDSIGPYRLMEQIGEGGFGLVFVAEQSEPVRRKVALKVLKPGMDTRDIVARFEAERQALALMDHPNIARVLDAGSTPSGRPYFVMELVRGVPVTEFADAHKLATVDRLSLFIQVCQAVQHAHQKGVIHRDLKPTNVLVTTIDGKPVPKVIDFGVAKAVGQSLTEKTVYTRFAQVLGTPLYMSPEQAEMSGVDVDTRADVYALGVLLYELLTGTTPFDRDRFRRAAFDEIRRIIREEEPPRPSTRLSSLASTLTDVSSNRGIDPAKLAGVVRGELDWIVMKCLEKDRNRRYETANGLARDVQRFLEGDSVEACPPTLGYRLRKFYRRNRAAVLIGSLILGLTYIGASGIYFAYQRAVDAERRLAAERDAAVASQARAVVATRTAVAEKDNAAKANASLRKLADEQRRTLYDSSLNVVAAAIESGDAPKALELLKRHSPASGEEDLRGFEWHYWNRQLHQELRSVHLPKRTESSSTFSSRVLTPDGTRAVAFEWNPAGGPQKMYLWATGTGDEIGKYTLTPGNRSALGAGFSADGRRVATVCVVSQTPPRANTIEVIDLTTGQTLYTSGEPEGKMFLAPSLSQDGSVLLFERHESKGKEPYDAVSVVRVADRKQLAAVRQIPSVSFIIRSALSPDGIHYAHSEPTGDPERLEIVLRKVGEDRPVWSLALKPKDDIMTMAFSPDGKRIMARVRGESANSVLVMELDGRPPQRFELPQPMQLNNASACQVSDRQIAAAHGMDVYVFDLDLPQGERNPPRVLRGHESRVPNLAFNADQSRLITIDDAAIIKEWGVASRPPALKRPFSTTLQTTPDGSRVMGLEDARGEGPSASALTKRLRITDGQGRQVGKGTPPLPTGHPHSLNFTPDGRFGAALWHSDQPILLLVWDLTSGRERLRKVLSGEANESLRQSGDGASVMFLSEMKHDNGGLMGYQTLSLLDADTGRELTSWKPPVDQGIRQADYSPDGRSLVMTITGQWDKGDNRLVWYDARTLAEHASLSIGKNLFVIRAFSPDGRRMAIGDLYGLTSTLQVWDTEPILQGKASSPICQIKGLLIQFAGVSFSPDGRRLLTCGEGKVKLWDIRTGGEVLSLSCTGNTTAARFSPDGTKIWAGVDDQGRLWGWDATPIAEAKTQ